MKKLIILIIFILSLSVVTAATPIYNYETLTLEESITNDIIIIPTRSNYQIQYFDLAFHLFPVNSYRQNTLSSILSPTPYNEVFTWQNPNDRTLKLNTRFTIQTSNQPIKIKDKIPFPLDSVPLPITKFVQPTQSIDINNDIRLLAQNLAQDVDDLFILEHRLSYWIHQNVAYNLSTLTANANYPSSWVLKSRYGVCDELTNLFISLNRALGIPARFVSGIAYSDSILFEEKWGNHGWAEVYFPGHGWIPYDITYQEFGELDATHIALKKEVDGTSPSVEYTTKGLYYNFEPTVLDFNTRVLKYGKIKQPKTELDLQIQESSVDFGSFNLFKLNIKNKNDYYIVEEVVIAKALELKYFEDARQSVVLKPREEKTIYWLVQVDSNLERNYVYTFPISAFATSGNSAEVAFSVLSRAENYNKNYMNQFIEEKKELTTTKTNVNCSHSSEYLQDETITLTCTINEEVKSICLQDDCKTNTNQANFSFPATTIGTNTAILTTTTTEGSKKHFFTYRVVDQATITIPTISITQNVEFEEFATLSVKLVKNSSANPKNVTMTLTHDMLEKEWFFSFLDKDKSFDIELPAQGFIIGENYFTITVTYLDSTNTWQTINATTSTRHASLSSTEKAIVYYNTYASKMIEQLTKFGISRYYAEIVAPAAIMLIFFAITSIFKNTFRFINRKRKLKQLEQLK